MTDRPWLLGVGIIVLLCGCAHAQDEGFRATLVVLNAIAEGIPDSVSVCVANRYLTDADSLLPQDLQHRLRQRGWHLYDPMVNEEPTERRTVPPGPRESMIVLGPPELEGDAWLVPAAYTETERRAGYVSWAMIHATRRVSCVGGQCEVVEVVGHGHGDGGMPAAAYDRLDRPGCGQPKRDTGRDEGP